jgi:hypothetical protein
MAPPTRVQYLPSPGVHSLVSKQKLLLFDCAESYFPVRARLVDRSRSKAIQTDKFLWRHPVMLILTNVFKNGHRFRRTMHGSLPSFSCTVLRSPTLICTDSALLHCPALHALSCNVLHCMRSPALSCIACAFLHCPALHALSCTVLHCMRFPAMSCIACALLHSPALHALSSTFLHCLHFSALRALTCTSCALRHCPALPALFCTLLH